MQALRIEVPDDIPVQSLIQVTALDVDDDMDDVEILMEQAANLPGMEEIIADRLNVLLAAADAAYARGDLTDADYANKVAEAPQKALAMECLQAIRGNRLACARVVEQQLDHNLILRSFWEDLFARLASGNSAGANQTLQIKYLSLGLSFAQSTFSQTTLTSEFYRDTPDEHYEDGVSTYYTTLYVKKTEANPTGNTTVTSATTTVITVASATGFIVGGRIQVKTAGARYNCTISAISSNDLTVTAITGGSLTNANAFDLLDIPQASDTVIALISEGGCIISDNATSTLNTGKAMNRRPLETRKRSLAGTPLSLLFDYILTGTSVDT